MGTYRADMGGVIISDFSPGGYVRYASVVYQTGGGVSPHTAAALPGVQRRFTHGFFHSYLKRR